ncbi:MAG: TraR/DksA family transcriptional regulator [Burkholderiales bacterium]|nr:TraR/DksA family transcriptional regulator [Burkholderiales bacterium]
MAGTALDDATRAQLRAQLDERQRTLREEVRAIDDEKEDAPRSIPMSHVEDLGEQGEERTREAVRHAEQERDIDELRAIAAAQARLDNGSYGLCVDCGVDIPLPRLQAQPAAARCIDCQAEFEKTHPAVPTIPLPPMP